MATKSWKWLGKQVKLKIRIKSRIRKRVHQADLYPETDLVILAGGLSRRMNGINKLLQRFDQQIQLLKIHQGFKKAVTQLWVNSHRDISLYQALLPSVLCYADDEVGFYGPLMGMKSAWSHVDKDYILFVPCDVTSIPDDVLQKLHAALAKQPLAQVAYVEINQQALYPFCLIKRSAYAAMCTQIEQQQYSLQQCFAQLNAQVVAFESQRWHFHSINSFDELQQYRQLMSI